MTAPAPVDLGPTTDGLAAIIAGVRDDQLGDRTPCPDFSVGDIVHHCLGLAVAFRAGARKEELPALDGPPPRPHAADLPEDWRSEAASRLAALAEAWRDPAAHEGMARVGGVTMPAPMTQLFALDEVVLHGWDLAVSTGQPFDPDDAALHAVHGLLAQSFEANPEGVPGLFGPPIPWPEDAPLLHRVLGLAGRHPGWTP